MYEFEAQRLGSNKVDACIVYSVYRIVDTGIFYYCNWFGAFQSQFEWLGVYVHWFRIGLIESDP